MAKTENIIGLDVGSGTVRVLVGEIDSEREDGLPKIIGMGMAPAQGIRKGNVVDVEDAVSSISVALEKAERLTGVPIGHAVVSISGSHINSQLSKGVIAVSRADGEIGRDDVDRVIEAAQAVAVPTNHEILHVVPKQFIVDNQAGIKDPIGMSGVRLEVEAHVILGATGFIKNLTKCVYRAGVDVSDLVMAPLAAGEAVLSKRQKELGVVLIDIGEGTTGLALYEEGDLIHAAILPIGAGHITNDIALELRTSVDTAERVKLEYGTALTDDIKESESIDLSKIDNTEEETVSRYHVAEVIEARVKEIFTMVDKELRKVDRSGKLPAGAVLCGGGAKLPGMVEMGKKVLKLPVQVGFPKQVPIVIDSIDDPASATALGLILWGAKEVQGEGFFSGHQFDAVSKSMDRMKKWFKNLLP